MNPRNPVPLWFAQGLVIAAMFVCAAPLKARSAPAQSAGPAASIKLYLEQATTGLPGRVEVSVGALDERMRLAPCARVEPYVPQGARLWGRGSIGLKCLDAAGWNVFLPIDVKVFARALVAARVLQPGDTAGALDVREEEVDLTRQSGVVVTHATQIDGKTAAHMIGNGQVLRQESFRAPPAVGAGDTVQLVFNGAGFVIVSDGRALANAADGQPVRVQTNSGRVVQGIARAGRVVDMK